MPWHSKIWLRKCSLLLYNVTSIESGNDSRSWINVSSWKRIMWKKFRFDQESNPDLCDIKCDALSILSFLIQLESRPLWVRNILNGGNDVIFFFTQFAPCTQACWFFTMWMTSCKVLKKAKMLKILTLAVADIHIQLYVHVRDTSVSHLWIINSCSHLKRSDWWLCFFLVLSAIKILCGDYGVVLLHNLRSTFRRWENLRVKILNP